APPRRRPTRRRAEPDPAVAAGGCGAQAATEDAVAEPAGRTAPGRPPAVRRRRGSRTPPPGRTSPGPRNPGEPLGPGEPDELQPDRGERATRADRGMQQHR